MWWAHTKHTPLPHPFQQMWNFLTCGRPDTGLGGCERDYVPLVLLLDFFFLGWLQELKMRMVCGGGVPALSPNWHLTAAPHGLITGSLFSWHRKQQCRIKHHPEGTFALLPSAPRRPHPHFPRSYLVREGVCTPRQPRVLIIALLSCSEIHRSSSSPISTFLFSPPGFSWPPLPPLPKQEQHEEDVRILRVTLHPGSEPRETLHTPDIWPRFLNLIFI